MEMPYLTHLITLIVAIWLCCSIVSACCKNTDAMGWAFYITIIIGVFYYFVVLGKK